MATLLKKSERAPADERNHLAIKVVDLHVSYQRSIKALQGVNLEVPQGKVVAILGANGAGKTTFLRTICGLLGFNGGAISQGSYHLWGQPADKLAPQRIVRLGVGQVLEGRRIFSELTVEENLDVGAISVRNRRATHDLKEHLFTQFPVLGERRNSVAGYLSGGEQQMLAIARALMSDPSLIVLDEPSLGLAPIIARQIAGIISDISTDGTTVLLVEQNAAMALSLSDYAYIFRHGKVAQEGPSEELRADRDILELYLGGGTSGGTGGDTSESKTKSERS